MAWHQVFPGYAYYLLESSICSGADSSNSDLDVLLWESQCELLLRLLNWRARHTAKAQEEEDKATQTELKHYLGPA